MKNNHFQVNPGSLVTPASSLLLIPWRLPVKLLQRKSLIFAACQFLRELAALVCDTDE